VDELEGFANEMSDRDADWWPFLALRPDKDARMSTPRVALLAILYGSMLGAIFQLIAALARWPWAVTQPLATPIVLSAVLFVVYRLTFAWAWNRRAERLKARRAAGFGVQ
jgi:hypothetical protein